MPQSKPIKLCHDVLNVALRTVAVALFASFGFVAVRERSILPSVLAVICLLAARNERLGGVLLAALKWRGKKRGDD